MNKPRTKAAIAASLVLALAVSAAPSPERSDADAYVVQFDKLDEAGAVRVEKALRVMDGIARLESNTRTATVRVWASKAEGAAHPQLLNSHAMQRRIKPLGLPLADILEPAWSKTKVYIVEATGGG